MYYNAISGILDIKKDERYKTSLQKPMALSSMVLSINSHKNLYSEFV